MSDTANQKLKKLNGRADYLRDEIKTVLDEAGSDRDFSKVTHIDGSNADKVEFIQKQSKELDDVVSQIEEIKEVEGIDEKIRNYEVEKNQPEVKMVQPDVEPVGHKSVGEMFVESKAYSSISGGVGEVSELNIDPNVLIKTDFTTSAGWAPPTVRTGLVIDSAQYPLRVADVIPSLSLIHI